MTDLLNCPFCGGEGAYQTDTEEESFAEEWIGCLECGATTALEVWNRRSASNTAGGEDVSGEQVLNVAHRIQSIMSEKLTVDEGEIMGVGPASYKIARLFKPAPTIQAGGDEPVATMHKSETETLFSKGWVPNLMGFVSTPLFDRPQSTPPALEGVTVTDEMVERACRVHNVGWSRWHEPQKKTAREVMRSTLTAALAAIDRGRG